MRAFLLPYSNPTGLQVEIFLYGYPRHASVIVGPAYGHRPSCRPKLAAKAAQGPPVMIFLHSFKRIEYSTEL